MLVVSESGKDEGARAARRIARRSDFEKTGSVSGKALVGATHSSDVDRSTRT